jgi:hypothetical protein
MTPLWLSVRGCSVGLVGEIVQGETDLTHHGFLITDLMREFQLNRYLKNNSSLFYFEKKAGIQFLDRCFDLYRERIYPQRRYSHEWIKDELALAIVGGQTDVNPLPKPDPFYWFHELVERTPTDFHRPMITLLEGASSEVAGWLVMNARRRRREAGVRDTTPIHWWVDMWLIRILETLFPKGTSRQKIGEKLLRYVWR